MLDTFNLPGQEQVIKTFYANSTNWQTWEKPNSAKFVSIVCIGAGGSGSGGVAGSNTTARAGGSGGGSAGYSIGFFSAAALPDRLYVQVPNGGAGVTGTTGNAGGLAYVTVQPNTTAINILMQSGAAAPNGGGNQTGGAAGTAWAGSILSNLGFVSVFAGQIGAAGTASNATPNNVTPAGMTTGGAAGGGCSSNAQVSGGTIVGTGFLNSVNGGPSFTGATGGDGSSYMSTIPSNNSSTRLPMIFLGGSGGGSSASFGGGKGGNASYGCGGGGSGAAFTGLQNISGNGGDGLVIITAW